VGSKVEAKAFKAEVLIGSKKPLHDQGRNFHGADGLLMGLELRLMEQRRWRQRKLEIPLVVYACVGIFMRISLSHQGIKM
jgi:hypothetical protein